MDFRDPWDLNADGVVDDSEVFMAMDAEDYMLKRGVYAEDVDEEEELDDELLLSGLDRSDLELMDPEERAEALEDAGLDPDDFDF